MSEACKNENCGISRRGFHRRMAAAAAGALASGVRFGHAAADAGTPSGKYVDMHVHLGQAWSPRGALPADQMLTWMDEHDVAQAVVLPLIAVFLLVVANNRKILGAHVNGWVANALGSAVVVGVVALNGWKLVGYVRGWFAG